MQTDTYDPINQLIASQARRARKLLNECGLDGDAFFLGGPSASAIVFAVADIEPVVATLAARTGDDPDDYTATDLS